MTAAHRNVGAAATAVFVALLLVGVLKHSGSASAAPAAAPAQQLAPQSGGGGAEPRGFGHRGFGGGNGDNFNNGTTR